MLAPVRHAHLSLALRAHSACRQVSPFGYPGCMWCCRARYPLRVHWLYDYCTTSVRPVRHTVPSRPGFEFPAGGVPPGHVTFHCMRARRARVERRECAACMWHSAACWRRAVVLSHMLCALCMQSCFSTPEARGGVGSEGPVVCGMLCAVAMLATEVARRALGLARKGAWRAALDAWANK